ALHAPRKTETTPVARSAFAEQGLRTTAIRFDDPISCGVGVIGMEFAQPADFGDTPALSNDDEAVLGGIAERLRAHGKIDRLGVRLIRNPLGISEHELLHETSDSGHRTLHCDVGERNAILSDQATVQTAWQWKGVQGMMQPAVMVECVLSCVRTVAGGGHDVQHTPHGPGVFDSPPRTTEVDESEIFGKSCDLLSRCSHGGFGFVAPCALNRQCSNLLHPDEIEPELDIT